MIKAKPVVPDQYWILRDQDHKVGNIEIDGGEYVVSINGHRSRFKNLTTLANTIRIDFEVAPASSPVPLSKEVHGYPTTGVAYNSIFDVQHQLPLWTSEPRSRSWLAAGWYRVRQHRDWQIVQCPKLILLQRYPYQGPFHSREQAQNYVKSD
jgi:hypothetical protein